MIVINKILDIHFGIEYNMGLSKFIFSCIICVCMFKQSRFHYNFVTSTTTLFSIIKIEGIGSAHKQKIYISWVNSGFLSSHYFEYQKY